MVTLILRLTWVFIGDTCSTQDRRFSVASPNSRDRLGMRDFVTIGTAAVAFDRQLITFVLMSHDRPHLILDAR